MYLALAIMIFNVLFYYEFTNIYKNFKLNLRFLFGLVFNVLYRLYLKYKLIRLDRNIT